jgi:hypothetical protein
LRLQRTNPVDPRLTALLSEPLIPALYSSLPTRFSRSLILQPGKMCIIFLAPQCPSNYASGHLVLLNSLESRPDIGLCVDPTSLSPIHCTKLEVRHKRAWYDKCQWCTKFATQWREGKVNECKEMDKAEAEKLEKRKSFEKEIVKREEEIVKKSQGEANKENEGPPDKSGRFCT